jgi:hypothetical protein
MPILFNTILAAVNVDLAEVRLLRHKDTSSAKGRTPYELWRDSREQFDLYQSTQNVSNETKLKARYWASFIGTPADETLFVGLFAVMGMKLLDQDTPMPHTDGIDKAGSCHIYALSLDERLSDLIGRLTID